MSQYVDFELSEWHALKRCCDRFTTAFRGEFSALREDEESRIVRLVFPDVFKGAR